MSEAERLTKAIVELDETEAYRVTEEMLEKKVEPVKIFAACRQGMTRVGELFERKEYYLSELIMASTLFKGIMELVKPRLKGDAGVTAGTILIGTVKGDIHDIGKNIVISVLEANGYQVIDLGVDVAPARFVEGIKEHAPQVVGLSALLTDAYGPMKVTVDTIEESGLRDRVKVILGGGAVSDKVKEYTGADAWATDVAAGQKIIDNWVGEANV
ncbi:MAG: cobalamin-binding protein [Firmicutes bacterium]|jgi:methanogenic corrinoid protein MtbC1|nr:cobalamin-binding protein [Bacillota bacterium]